jgi:aspartate/methionine/tyrosine aminotransferase
MKMPRPPEFSAFVREMPGAVYSPFADRLRDHPGPLYPLHVGDTYLEPFIGARMQDQRVEDHSGLHQYCDTRGLPVLVDAIVEKARTRNGLACERESVLVSAGATAGLACAMGAVVSPGEEVLILAPFWPLIRGIVQGIGGRPVEVPFYDRVETADEAVSVIRDCLSDHTVALYVSTPSNPTGRVLPRAWLEAIAELATAHDLWLFSDEVYEDFVYTGEHISIGALAPGRTTSFFSFSKAFGMAGNRVGYLVGPPEWVDEARKLGTHSYYNAPTAAQQAARVALQGGAPWQQAARAEYRRTAEDAAGVLGVPAPEGSTFLFLNVADQLGERGMRGLLEDCFAAGVLVAPGASSGRAYEDWIRLCYTTIPPEETGEAVRRLAGVLCERRAS